MSRVKVLFPPSAAKLETHSLPPLVRRMPPCYFPFFLSIPCPGLLPLSSLSPPSLLFSLSPPSLLLALIFSSGINAAVCARALRDGLVPGMTSLKHAVVDGVSFVTSAKEELKHQRWARRNSNNACLQEVVKMLSSRSERSGKSGKNQGGD
eukprot:678727-Hanusia_phi.AAC.3